MKQVVIILIIIAGLALFISTLSSFFYALQAGIMLNTIICTYALIICIYALLIVAAGLYMLFELKEQKAYRIIVNY